MDKHIEVTLKRSLIGRSKKTRATVYALGLRKINSKKVHKLNDPIKGMIDKIHYLLEVREIDPEN